MKREQFIDRCDAGRKLALRLQHLRARGALVLGLPRGGVPVAAEVARFLQAPLDVWVVRKLGMPHYREFAMGAIASGGITVVNEESMRFHRVPWAAVEEVIEAERQELSRREKAFRDDRPRPQIHGRDVILVDDGLATGATMKAAVQAIMTQQPKSVTAAIPLAESVALQALRPLVDELVCLAQPEPFVAVSLWYEHFPQVEDREVKAILRESLGEAVSAP